MKKTPRPNQRLFYERIHGRAALVGSKAFSNFGTERGGASKNNTLYVVNHSCIPTLLEQLQPFGTLYCCPFLAPCPRLDHKRVPGEEYLSNIKIMNIKYISFCMFVHTFSNKGFQPTVQLSKSMVSSNSSEPLYNNVFNSNFGTHAKEQNSFANLTFGK